MVSIVSLAWNKYDLTKEFLERLKKYTPIEHELIFTDNGSTEDIEKIVYDTYDGFKSVLYEREDRILYVPNLNTSGATFIKKRKNVGCPATRNEAMEHAKGDIVFWLDNDTYVEEGWYKPFLEALKPDNVGIVGVDGRRIRNPFNYSNPWVFEQELYSFDVDWFVGYAVAFKRECYKPIPDWNLSVNFDDVDMCLGVKTFGKKAVMLDEVPNLKHLGSQTGKAFNATGDTTKEFYEKWWNYWSPHSNYFEEYIKNDRQH